MNSLISKLRVSSLGAALAVFFLPWLAVQCDGSTVVTQSGIQVVYSGQSFHGVLGDSPEDHLPQGGDAEGGKLTASKTTYEGEIGVAPLVGVAMVVLIAGFCFALFSLLYPSGRKRLDVLLASAACLLLLTQAVIGFPLENKMQEARDEEHALNTEGKERVLEVRALDEVLEIAESRTIWFYLELALLLTPALLLLIERKSEAVSGSEAKPNVAAAAEP